MVSPEEKIAMLEAAHRGVVSQMQGVEADLQQCVEELDVAKQSLREWLQANGPGGWIDALRAERDAKAKRVTDLGCLYTDEKVRREQAEAERDAALDALQEVVNVLGPTPGCGACSCEGCLYEMGHALKVAHAALAAKDKA